MHGTCLCGGSEFEVDEIPGLVFSCHCSRYRKAHGAAIACLDAWSAEAPDDAAGSARALSSIARACGMAHVARAPGLSRESLYRALSANGNPSFATVLKVTKALGLRLSADAA